jgi:hypothetical protein
MTPDNKLNCLLLSFYFYLFTFIFYLQNYVHTTKLSARNYSLRNNHALLGFMG